MNSISTYMGPQTKPEGTYSSSYHHQGLQVTLNPNYTLNPKTPAPPNPMSWASFTLSAVG